MLLPVYYFTFLVIPSKLEPKRTSFVLPLSDLEISNRAELYVREHTHTHTSHRIKLIERIAFKKAPSDQFHSHRSCSFFAFARLRKKQNRASCNSRLAKSSFEHKNRDLATENVPRQVILTSERAQPIHWSVQSNFFEYPTDFVLPRHVRLRVCVR